MKPQVLYRTQSGDAYWGDSLEVMASLPSKSVDLVLTSPPFALRRKKSYGNVSAEEYADWFAPFARQVYRILKRRGSFVLDIGGSWNPGRPTRSLYHFELLLRLCKPKGPFHLAQEFYWHNPAKMPGPAEWVTIRRIRVTDAVNPIWWLARDPRPKATNRRVLREYSKSMEDLFKRGYNAGERPSGHIVSRKWNKRQGGSIPTNLITAANTRSSDAYLRGCKRHSLEVHPARFVEAVPDFFIRFLTRPGDLVLDPFAGSNVVGMVAQKLRRKWLAVDISSEYVAGSALRFPEIGRSTLQKLLLGSHPNPLSHSGSGEEPGAKLGVPGIQ